MRSLLATVLAAALAATVSYAVRQWLERRAREAPTPRKPIETWENEGGALAPQHILLETSQVPR
jgi:hypothetical protein